MTQNEKLEAEAARLRARPPEVDELIQRWRAHAARRRNRAVELDHIGRLTDAALYEMQADIWCAAADELEALLRSPSSQEPIP